MLCLNPSIPHIALLVKLQSFLAYKTLDKFCYKYLFAQRIPTARSTIAADLAESDARSEECISVDVGPSSLSPPFPHSCYMLCAHLVPYSGSGSICQHTWPSAIV
jgi:hypothetical protein